MFFLTLFVTGRENLKRLKEKMLKYIYSNIMTLDIVDIFIDNQTFRNVDIYIDNQTCRNVDIYIDNQTCRNVDIQTCRM